MIFTGARAMKEVKFLEEEKEMLLAKEKNNSTTVEVDGKVREVEEYDFYTTRKSIREIDRKIKVIKHGLNNYNTTTEIENGKTIDMALVELAQLSRELDVVREMKGRAKEAVEERYSNMYIRRVNYDITQVERYYQELIKEVQQLQLAIDTANLTVTFEIKEY